MKKITKHMYFFLLLQRNITKLSSIMASSNLYLMITEIAGWV